MQTNKHMSYWNANEIMYSIVNPNPSTEVHISAHAGLDKADDAEESGFHILADANNNHHVTTSNMAIKYKQQATLLLLSVAVYLQKFTHNWLQNVK